MTQLRPPEVHEGSFNVNGKEIKVLANRNPEELPWGELGVNISF